MIKAKTEQLFKTAILLENDITNMQNMMVQMTQRLSVLQNELYAIQNMMEPPRPLQPQPVQNGFGLQPPIHTAMYGKGLRQEPLVRNYDELARLASYSTDYNVPGCPAIRRVRLDHNPSAFTEMSRYAELFRAVMELLGADTAVKVDQYLRHMWIGERKQFNIDYTEFVVISFQMQNLDLDKEWYDWFMEIILRTVEDGFNFPVLKGLAAPTYGQLNSSSGADLDREVFLEQSISHIKHFSNYEVRCLNMVGIQTVKDLFNKAEVELVSQKGIGPATYTKIMAFADFAKEKHNVDFRQKDSRLIEGFNLQFDDSYCVAMKDKKRLVIHTTPGFAAEKIPNQELSRRIRNFVNRSDVYHTIPFVRIIQ